MPGIEVIVRPSVFPDIRPKSRNEGTAPDPEAGRCRLTGADGLVLDLNLSLTQSMSKQHGQETKRVYDIARIYRTVPNQDNPEAAPRVDRDTYLDVEVPHQVRLEQYRNGPTIDRYYRKPQPEDYPNGNVEIIEENLVRENPRT